MKNWRMWAGFAIVIVIAGVGIGAAYVWWLAEPAAPPSQGQIAIVGRGPLSVALEAVGAVASPSEETLTFAVGGRIQEIAVKESERVQVGDILARLDAVELELQVQQAQAALELSEARLTQAQRKPTALELDAARAALEAAQARYDQVGVGPTEAEIAAAQAAISSAEAKVADLQRGPTEEEVRLARLKVDEAKNALWGAQATRDAVAGSKSASQAQKDAAEAAVLNAEVAVQAAEVELQQLYEPPTAAERQAAAAQLAQARANYETLLAKADNDELMAAAAQIRQAEANLEKLENRPLPEEVEMARAQVRAAELALAAAQHRLEGAALRAPASGTVVDLRASVGQTVAAGTAIIVLSDLSAPTIEVQVHESEVAALQPGSAARVRLHAYPQRWLDGQVDEIAPLPSGSGALVSYKVSIALGADQVAARPGMTADVQIPISEQEAALLVPRGALRREGGQWVVQVRSNGRWEEAVVSLGVRTGRYVEVLEGLTEGAQVRIHTVPVALSQPDLGDAPSQRAGGR
ncbi:MAG: efflux RND transporter periplasmic adaptor subunit [Anaerolineae bacterium]|nr:efflux RND transporter periplasmic adaptor subunit [Anaerolineae bacterium]